MHPRVPPDLGRAGGRDPLPDDVVGVADELEQAGPDDVRVGHERQLHLEAVGHGHVVGVHPGDHVEPARRQPAVQRGPEAAVAPQRHERHRHRAGGPELVQAPRELVPDRAVPDDDHLVRAHGLVVDRAAERPPQVVGPVPVVHRDQEREGLVHMQNSPSFGEMPWPAGQASSRGLAAE